MLHNSVSTDGKVIFEMRSWKAAKYIAMGLSTDKEMGDDSVMECVKEGDEIKAYSSWTVVGANYASVREGIVSCDIKFKILFF